MDHDENGDDRREQPIMLTSEFIERCFFILDEDGRDERCPPEEVMLFFYPDKGMNLNAKLFLQGSVFAMIKFVEHFTTEFPKTIALQRAKFSAKQVEEYTLVATGHPDEADGVLQNHIEALYSAYRFYYGSLPHVAARFKDRPRAELIACIQEQCNALIPLIHGFRKKGKLNAFLWLPFSSPPPNTSRHFMQASNFLSSLQIQGGTYGGCMFYDSSVLCTHVDVEITRWILNLVEFLKTDRTVTRTRYSSRDYSDTPSIFLPVFLTNDQLAKLGVEAETESNEYIQATQLLAERLKDKYQYLLDPPSDGSFLTLFIVFKGHISLAILMDITKLYDDRYISKLKFNPSIAFEARLSNLDKDIQTSYLKKGLKRSSSITPRDQVDDALAAPSFHYLTTDSLTGMTKGSVLNSSVSMGEKEERFLLGASYVHEAYTNRQIAKVMLGDHCGLIYSRHMFSKEIFYQRPFTPANASDNILEKLEESAHRQLSELNIQLI